MKIRLSILLMITLGAYVHSHEGHDMPGAMPPAPHGGEVKAAEHDEKEESKEKHAEKGHEHHEEEGEIEIFFEVVYAKKAVKIYPLTLNPKNPKVFSSLPTNSFKDVSLSIELPRQKKTEAVQVNVTETSFDAAFDPKAVFRFFANISAKYEGEEKKAKVQVELE